MKIRTVEEMVKALHEQRGKVLLAAFSNNEEFYLEQGRIETDLVTDAMIMGFTIREIGDAQTKGRIE